MSIIQATIFHDTEVRGDIATHKFKDIEWLLCVSFCEVAFTTFVLSVASGTLNWRNGSI